MDHMIMSGGDQRQGRDVATPRRSPMHDGFVAVLMIFAAVALVACGGGTKAATTQAPIPPVSSAPELSDASAQPLPLDSYLLTEAQWETIDNGYRAVVRRCMNRFGYTFTFPTGPTAAANDGGTSSLRVSGHFGPQSLTFAERWGYHPEGGLQAAAAGAAPPAQRLTGAEQQALTGAENGGQKFGPGGQVINGLKVPDHGCLGEGTSAITGSVDPNSVGDSPIATGLEFDTMARAQQDSRVQAVFAKWSQCMSGNGYHYATPLDVLKDPRWQQSDMPTQSEIQTAVADQQCRAKENVVGVWYSVDYAYEKQALDQHAEQMAVVKQHVQDQLQSAAKALGG